MTQCEGSCGSRACSDHLVLGAQAVGGVPELTSSLGLAIEWAVLRTGENVLHDLQQTKTLERIVSKRTYRNYIAGDGSMAADGRRLDILDPSDGFASCRIARSGSEDVDRAVKAARAALAGDWAHVGDRPWSHLLGSARGPEEYQSLAELEAGTSASVQAGAGRLEALARYFEFYGAAADKVHGDTIPYRTGFTPITLYEPHGVTAHIIPELSDDRSRRSLGAALAMGNAAVVKPAEEPASR